MNFWKRLQFFGFGILLGTLLSIVLFGPERFSCSGYLPESRVLAELQTKKFHNDTLIQKQLNALGMENDSLIKEKILKNSSIDFEESQPRLEPCGQYYLYYPKDSVHYRFSIYKCDSTAYFKEIKKL